MGLLDNIGKFKVQGSIQTQFETTIALERIMYGLGQKATGITSVLMSLEFIGYVLMIFWGLFFLALMLFIHIVLFIVSIYKYFWTPKQNTTTKTKQTVEDEVDYELTPEQEEEISNFH